jgi:AcrR family transcriptional regulator
MSVAEPLRRPGGRTAETTRRVFGATMELLVEGGYPHVTFQSVAERAAVGRATLYRRWPEPAMLIAEAIRASASESICIPDTGDFEEDLRQLLCQIAEFISSPTGRAALIAALPISRDCSAISMEHLHWATRWIEVAPIFERAARRSEIASGSDFEMNFAQAAGAIYFRVIVMGMPIDPEWIGRAVKSAMIGVAIK